MTEKEKMLAGQLYDPSDPELVHERLQAKDLCQAFNLLGASAQAPRMQLLKSLLGKTSNQFEILPTFFCDYGYNIFLGENFFANHNLVILDCMPVRFGDHVFIGPNCGFYTARHPLQADERVLGHEDARPITVGDRVWIGGGVQVLPGVTIGDACVIGAGSVVTCDLPPHSLAFGNPAKVQRTL